MSFLSDLLAASRRREMASFSEPGLLCADPYPSSLPLGHTCSATAHLLGTSAHTRGTQTPPSRLLLGGHAPFRLRTHALVVTGPIRNVESWARKLLRTAPPLPGPPPRRVWAGAPGRREKPLLCTKNLSHLVLSHDVCSAQGCWQPRRPEGGIGYLGVGCLLLSY